MAPRKQAREPRAWCFPASWGVRPWGFLEEVACRTQATVTLWGKEKATGGSVHAIVGGHWPHVSSVSPGRHRSVIYMGLPVALYACG